MQTITTEKSIINRFEGKNCRIKNNCNCLGEAPSVSNSFISSLQELIVSCMKSVKMRIAKTNISNPVTPEILTTRSTTCLYLLNLVLS